MNPVLGSSADKVNQGNTVPDLRSISVTQNNVTEGIRKAESIFGIYAPANAPVSTEVLRSFRKSIISSNAMGTKSSTPVRIVAAPAAAERTAGK